MATAPEQTLEPAQEGDELTPAELGASFDLIMDLAQSLDADIASNPDGALVRQAMTQQADLRARARALLDASIRLQAGEARVTADHIRSAAAAAKTVIDDITETKQRLAKISALFDFVGAVLTGSGTTIYKGAVELKKKLDEK